MLVGCSGGVIVDNVDTSAFVYDPAAWGVNKTIVEIGQLWSAGSITLCRKSQNGRVVLQDVSAVSVVGQVRLDGIGVRTAHYSGPNEEPDPDIHLIGTLPRVPAGLRKAAGFVVTTTCPTSEAPVVEIVVTLTKIGPQGGALDGLKVEYRENSSPHELTINFHFGLCGTGESAVPCAKDA
jgi:hypothetical protein